MSDEESKTIDMNYPHPVKISSLVKAVSEWSEYCLIMEPSLDRAIQIFAPKKLSPKEAFDLFITSIDAVGLKAISVEDNIVKIVQKKPIVNSV